MDDENKPLAEQSDDQEKTKSGESPSTEEVEASPPEDQSGEAAQNSTDPHDETGEQEESSQDKTEPPSSASKTQEEPAPGSGKGSPVEVPQPVDESAHEASRPSSERKGETPAEVEKEGSADQPAADNNASPDSEEKQDSRPASKPDETTAAEGTPAEGREEEIPGASPEPKSGQETASPTKSTLSSQGAGVPDSQSPSKFVDGIRVYETAEDDGMAGAADTSDTPAEALDPLDMPPPAPPAPTTLVEESAKTEVTFAPSELTGDEANIITGNALNMVWSFGINRNVPVVNLTTETRRMIVYVCAHSGVCYNLDNNTQKLLQGHSNAIACTCASEDKRWLATADQGQANSMVIIWNTANFVPVQTIFDAGEFGVAAMALTPDARYLVTISAPSPPGTSPACPQVAAVWDWTSNGDTAVCSAQLELSCGPQTYVLFDPSDTTQFVTNGEHQVVFYNWAGGKMEYYTPPLTDDDFNKPVGKYTQSVYLEGTHRALTATTIGNIVVWDSNLAFGKALTAKTSPDKKALKLVKVQDKGINVLMIADGRLVLGDANGHVRFLDFSLNLLHWYQDLGVGPVNSVSFTYEEAWSETLKDVSHYPNDTSLDSHPLVIRDFIVGATNAIVANISAKGTDINIVLKDHDSAVWSLDTHPSRAQLCIGSYSGLLQLWDYSQRVIVASRTFDRAQMIQCVTFDSQGQYLAVGFTNGTVRVLDGLTLLDTTARPLRYARDSITHLAFSKDCKLLAAADAEYTTTLYQHISGDGDDWGYVGRHRAHYKPVQDMMFGTVLDSDKPRLLTLGKDRCLVEYDLANARQDHLPLHSVERIEQSGLPQCMTWSPALSKESFILTANDQYKLKLYNTSTKMCRRTLLGPTYGSPLKRIVEIPIEETDDKPAEHKYLAYINDDMVGMIIMPLDGNPHNSMCLVAHPEGTANLAVSHDGKYLFTAGGQDSTVHQWLVNLDALEAQSKLGGADLLPFYGLLEGGREGDMFKELEDYFYYAQLRSQGINTMKQRQVATTIPLSEVPFVMRAMGFYPSEQEIEEMLNEVKFSRYVQTGTYVNSINLEDFLKLYLNHRPAFGLSMEQLRKAFITLSHNGTGQIDRRDWITGLQRKGEHMTELELSESLTTLLGYNEEGGSCEEHVFDASRANSIVTENLPAFVDGDYFQMGLLGMTFEEPPTEAGTVPEAIAQQ